MYERYTNCLFFQVKIPFALHFTIRLNADILKVTNNDKNFEDFLRRVKIDVDYLSKCIGTNRLTVYDSEKRLYAVVRSLESLRFKVRTVLLPRIKEKE